MSKIKTIRMEHMKFAFDWKIPPVASIKSGERMIFETEDANVSLITKENDLYTEFSKLYELGGGCNPVTGPIYVEGANPGDNLSVEILRIVPGFIRGGGYTSVFSGLGALQDSKGSLQEPLEPRTKICDIEGDEIIFKTHEKGEIIKIPLKPFVGTIGVAPKEDRRSSFYQGQDWCGNVDIPDIKVGTTVVLPVHHEGALFSIGDIHACQGDGEITGCALECQGIVEVKITVIPKEESTYVDWPQLNTDDYIGSIAALGYRNLSEGMRIGYTDLVRRMVSFYGFDALDAYQLLNLAGEFRIGNQSSSYCRISRKLLETHKPR
jgi:amidase